MTPTDAAGSDVRPGHLRRIEAYLSNLLRIGVGISIVLLLGGVLVSMIRHPDYMTDTSALARLKTPGSAFPQNLQTLVSEVRHVRGRALMTVGLLVLMATPVVRVAASVVAFLFARDWRFALITASVLGVIVLSVFLGKAK